MSRSALLFLAACATLIGHAQRIDSVHIFQAIPRLAYSTSLAETTGWHLQRSGATYVTIGPADLANVNEGLAQRKPTKHEHTALPGLSHLGFAYLGKAAHVFCLADDDALIIDLTARRQFRFEDWTDRVKLRAALVALGL